MKKFTLSTLLLLLMLGVKSFAQWIPTANLTIFSEDGEKFFLVLNGERYNDVPQTNIRIEELPNPYYNCKIIFENKSLPEITRNALMLADADGMMQDVTYRIKRDNKGRNVLRFFSQRPAEQNMVRPANCATYRFGAPNVMLGASPMNGLGTTTTIRQTTTAAPVPNVNVNIGGVGVNMNFDAPMMGGTVTTTTTTTTTTSSGFVDDGFDDFGAQRNAVRGRNRNHVQDARRGGCGMGMNNRDFEDARRTVANNGFDETRLSTAKQIISSNCMNTNQIVSILGLFSFEASKLDFAKYAFDYCIDRNNYFKVSNSFSFESSKTELNNYVQSMR